MKLVLASQNKKKIKEMNDILAQLGVEGDWVGVGNCVLGYAADPLKPVIPRKEGRVVRCD